jgi:hypothetical protein
MYKCRRSVLTGISTLISLQIRRIGLGLRSQLGMHRTRVRYSWVRYSWVRYSWVRYSWVRYSWVLYSWVLYSWVLYSWVLYSWVRYSWVPYSWVRLFPAPAISELVIHIVPIMNHQMQEKPNPGSSGSMHTS